MIESIIGSFDVWTDAQGVKSKGRVRSVENISLEGIARLRELILELAVRGKLVAQDDGDEPVGELLKRIEKEKKYLLKTGKLRSQSVVSQIANNEKKYVLPTGWEFVRFGNVTFNRDAERIPLSVDERQVCQGPFDYYGASGVIDSIDNFIFDKPLLLIGEDGANLINRSTPIAFIAKGKYWVNNHAHVIDAISEDFLNYLCMHINAISLLPYITGTAQPKMNQAKMNSIVLALPPLAEQSRIVAKVDSLMALCEKLETAQKASLKTHQTLVTALLQTLTAAKDAEEVSAAWARLAPHIDTLFCTEDSIEQLKQTILQLAVMGRLVAQDPVDEPAVLTLKTVKEVNEKLSREGKIKRSKTLPKAANEEISFALPIGWAPVRLNEVGEWGAGATPNRSNGSYYGGNIPWFKSGELSSDYIDTSEEYVTELALKDSSLRYNNIGDVLLAMYGATIGKASILKIRATTNQAVCACTPFPCISNAYLLMLLKAYKTKFAKMGAGGAQPNISREKIISTAIGLPPLAEQERIVAKVDALFALCDALKARIEAARGLKVSLSKTVVENAVG